MPTFQGLQKSGAYPDLTLKVFQILDCGEERILQFHEVLT